MMLRLEGKIAAFARGSQGIGRAIAERLSSDGADAAICYRSNRAGAIKTPINKISSTIL